jgi:RHS repeat-associated protein
MAFDRRLALTGISAAGSGTTLWSLTNTFNSTGNNGNIVNQSVDATGAGGVSTATTFSYDRLNRLQSSIEGSNGVNQTYGYDSVGNRWVNSGTMLSSLTPSAPTSFDASTNRLSGTQIAHDPAGNLTGMGAYSFTYDAESRIQTETLNGLTAQFWYDGEGRRVKKQIGQDPATVFIYDAAGELAAEYGAGSGVGTQYLVQDPLGSTRMVVDTAGNVALHDYLPFGEEITSGVGGRSSRYGAVDAVNQKFTGKERDGDSGLVSSVSQGLDYFGFRYLSSAQGRFTSVDPAMASGVLDDPQTWNRYSYVSNRPLAYTDPNGLIPVPLVAGAIGAGTAAVGTAASQYLSTGHVDWGKVGIAAGGGFVAGATFGPVGGLVAKVAASPWVTSAVAGVATNVLGGIVTRAGNAAADGTDPADVVSADALESDAAYGVLGGVLGEAAGRFWRVLNEPYLPKRPSLKAHSAQSQAAKVAYNQAVRTLNDQSTGAGNSASTWFGAFFTNIFAPLRETKPVVTTKICFFGEDGRQSCQ